MQKNTLFFTTRFFFFLAIISQIFFSACNNCFDYNCYDEDDRSDTNIFLVYDSVFIFDTLISKDTLVLKDTVYSKDTVVHKDTVYSKDTVVFRDSVYSKDTLVFRDSVYSKDTLVFRDSVYSKDTLVFRDSVYSKDTLVFRDSVYSKDTLVFRDSVYSKDTLVFKDTIYFKDTLVFRDTVYSKDTLVFRDSIYSKDTLVFKDTIYFKDTLVFRDTVYSKDTLVVSLVDSTFYRKMSSFVIYSNDKIKSTNQERFYVFYKNGSGFIRYSFVHNISIEKNSNIWRMDKVFLVDSLLNEVLEIVTDGEWEFAVKIKERPDFSGGIAHGNELYNYVNFFIDGKNNDSFKKDSIYEFEEFRVVQISTMYDPNYEDIVIAKRECEHIFHDKSLKIRQTIKWENEDNIVLTYAYLGMFPASKKTFTKYYYDQDNSIEALGERKILNNAKRLNLIGNNALAEFTIEHSTNSIDGVNRIIITDNSSEKYFKCYNIITTKESILNPKEIWTVTVNYKIMYNDRSF